MKPVRLPAAATRALPRWGLFAISLLYILPGLIGRDPWKNDDAASFGIMWTMAHGTLQDWLQPNIVGLPMPLESPLAYWLGAACIKLLAWLLGDILAARFSTVIYFFISSASIWYATYLLGRRPEAQPFKLAFGGQPEPRDFGRTLADGAFLIYLGLLGLLQHSHETSAKTMQIALIAYALYSGVRVFDTPRLHSAIFLGLALGLLVLTHSWLLPIGIFIGLLILASLCYRSILQFLIGITMPIALCMSIAGVAVMGVLLFKLGGDKPVHPSINHQLYTWFTADIAQLDWPTWASLQFFLKYSVWFIWPAWPFAGWAIIAWRRQLASLHISLPLALLCPLSLLVLSNIKSEESIFLPLLPALSILAAFGLPTMKRGAINAVDWFSVMTLTTCAAFIWMAWIATEIYWPAQLAKNAYKLAPGYQSGSHVIALSIAMIASLFWILLVYWRISRRPSVLWRAVVLSSGGVILCWVLLMTLWLPWADYRISYAGLGRQIAAHIPSEQACILSNVGPAQRASFAYFGHLNFASSQHTRCHFLLLQDHADNQHATHILGQYAGTWQLWWQGHRPADRSERFRLYHRQP